MTYLEKLQHPKWQKRRLEIMTRDNWSCVECDSTDTTLQVHHTEYHKGKDPWDYEDEFLITLCKVCHKKEHYPEQELPRKYEHLIKIKTEPEIITSINQQLYSLQEKLKDKLSEELMYDILKNIMFLQSKKKELI